MTIETIDATAVDESRRTPRRTTAAFFLAGGLLTAVGGGLHPTGVGDTVDAHLLSMFDSPQWPLSHWLLLAGAVASTLAFVWAWRTHAFGPRVQRWLPLVAAAWGVGAAELVPHLLASQDAHALAHHDSTPMLDTHLSLAIVAGPAVGLSGALIAVVIARAARSRIAWVLAAVAVIGGLLYGAATPLIVITDDPAISVLFAAQTGLAVWLIGTGIRLLRQ